jgi:Xaa-Pro aminopeptidase
MRSLAVLATVVTTVLALAPAAPAGGQPAVPHIALAEYQARRDSLAARLGDGVVVAFGAREPMAAWQPFRQLPGFAYLTSFAEPDAVLVLRLRGGRATGQVYVQVPDARYQLYVGIPAESASVARETGLARRDIAALRPALDSLARAGLPFHVARDVGSGDAAGRDTVTLGASFLRDLARAHPGLRVGDAQPVLDRLRARKSPAEVALLRRAIAATDSGHAAALRAVRPGAVSGRCRARSRPPSCSRRRGAVVRQHRRARGPTRPRCTTRATTARCGAARWW